MAKENTYQIIRTIKEYFEVTAESKKEAVENLNRLGAVPNCIDVVKETVKKVAYDEYNSRTDAKNKKNRPA